MARICAELRLEVNESPLSILPESVGPITPLTLVLLDFVLTESTPPDDFGLAKFAEEGEFVSERHPEESAENCGQKNYEWLSEEVRSVNELYVEDGDLHLTLTVESRDRLRDLIAGIERRHGTVSIERLTEVSECDEPVPNQNGHRQRSVALLEQENNCVDLPDKSLRQLTERQYEVLIVAYENGYFEYPRGANAEDVAEKLGITASTFAEHLSAAQSKLVGGLLDPVEQNFDR